MTLARRRLLLDAFTRLEPYLPDEVLLHWFKAIESKEQLADGAYKAIIEFIAIQMELRRRKRGTPAIV